MGPQIINSIYLSWCNFYLRKILGLSKVGKNVSFQRGFRVYNGAQNISIGDNVELVDTFINAGDTSLGAIYIGKNVFFGHQVMIISRGHNYLKNGANRKREITEKPIIIEEGVWIGTRSIILGGVTIGRNSVTAAGSVITKSIPANSICAGIPAKVIKKIP
jgi:acetyltransferase-like isoleucine patch superfamily enzyme